MDHQMRDTTGQAPRDARNRAVAVDGAAHAPPGDEHALPEHVRKVRKALRQGTYSTDRLVDAALDRLLSGLARD